MSKVQAARLGVAAIAAVLLSGCALNPAKLIGGGKEKPPAEKAERKETPEFWRKDGAEIAERAQKGQTSRTKARNIIVFVGQGMGVSTVTAARILAGQDLGATGEEAELSFEAFPATALAKTYNFDRQSPQSAGSMTALMTGLKTRGSSISLNQEPRQGECQTAEQEEPTLLERAKASGLAAGLVTTGRVTHAGPAAAYAHASSPNWEVDRALDPAAQQAGCTDIARQLVEFDQKGPLDVVFGGGRMAFKPEGEPESPGSARNGVRAGPEDLIKSWLDRGGGTREYMVSRNNLLGYKWKDGPVLGLFTPDHMSFEAERKLNAQSEPSLTEMTAAAIAGLKRNKEGFVLVVVASGIGRGHDQATPSLALYDTIELSRAVAEADKLTSDKDTLIIVTADHGSTLTLGGGAARGSPILGAARGAGDTPLADRDGQAYPALAYGNGPSRPGSGPPSADNKGAAGFQAPAALALAVTTGGGEDVPVYARGPGSQWIHGTLDQHALYWIIRAANPTLERGKPIKKIAGVTPPQLPKLPKVKLPFGK